MKSRGIYETPGGSILSVARRAMESLTLDREAATSRTVSCHAMRNWSIMVSGIRQSAKCCRPWWIRCQEHVEGIVRLKLYKGNVIVVGRKSPKSLYKDALVTFEDDRGAYDQKDAAGLSV